MSSKECPSIERYEYKSLDYTTQQIRLIRLLEPTVDDDRMCLHIDIFDMSEAPPYTALSYVWGLPTSLYDVYIKDEKLEDTKLQVRENLYDFLVEFRVQEETEHSDQYLWIDQLAIDQATNLERNHQVQMMSDIYSNAESVIVWLGKAQSDYEAARTYQKTGHHEAFTAILHNNYFDRLWVMQEFLLAKRLRLLVKNVWICNEDFTHITAYHATKFTSESSRKEPRPATRRLIRTRQEQQNEQRRYERLDELLIISVQKQCANPRDKIFGVLGLAEPRYRVVVDYAKPISEVYMQVCLLVCAITLERLNGNGAGNPESQRWKRETQLHALTVLKTDFGFTPEQESSLSYFLYGIWRPETLGSFYGLPCPITASGLELADGSQNTSERWWFEIQDKKYYIECNWFRSLTNGGRWWAPTIGECRPLHVDWNEYLPQPNDGLS